MLPGGLDQGTDGGDVGGTPVCHAVAGEEAGNMQRNFPALFTALNVLQACNPCGESSYFVFIVVFPGNDEGGQFHMAAFHGFLNKAHHCLTVSAEDLPVIPVCKPFQVDVHRIDIRKKLVKNIKVRGTVGDHDIEHPVPMYQPCGIPDIFPADQWFVIGEGHTDIPAGNIVGGKISQPFGDMVSVFTANPSGPSLWAIS